MTLYRFLTNQDRATPSKTKKKRGRDRRSPLGGSNRLAADEPTLGFKTPTTKEDRRRGDRRTPPAALAPFGERQKYLGIEFDPKLISSLCWHHPSRPFHEGFLAVQIRYEGEDAVLAHSLMVQMWIENRRVLELTGRLDIADAVMRLPRLVFKADKIIKKPQRIEAFGEIKDQFTIHLLYDEQDAYALFLEANAPHILKSEFHPELDSLGFAISADEKVLAS
jgi:hypothetical protein